jgi:hypothetical protein
MRRALQFVIRFVVISQRLTAHGHGKQRILLEMAF